MQLNSVFSTLSIQQILVHQNLKNSLPNTLTKSFKILSAISTQPDDDRPESSTNKGALRDGFVDFHSKKLAQQFCSSKFQSRRSSRASIPCAAIKLAANDLWLNCLAFGRKNTNLHCDLILSENFDGGYYYIFFTSHKKTWQACTPPIGQI